MKRFSGLILLCVLALPVGAQNSSSLQPLGIGLESFPYPRPVHFLALQNGGQDVRMAYQDAPAFVGAKRTRINRTPVLLLHGKNFGGYYWSNVIISLNKAGYRVIVPDQIGFGKSSKPDITYSFDLLANNTAKLLDTLKVPKVIVVGHSMGGMLATHFARRFPNRVEKLVLENPIGLEDYGAATGNVPLPRLYSGELKDTDPAKIRAFYKHYFVAWKPQFEVLPRIKVRVTQSGEFPRWAKSSAQTYKMILEQPVVGEFPLLRVPTLLIIGQGDRTIVGKNYIPSAVVRNFGNYPALGKSTAKAIPGARLVEIPNVGHIPHLEAPEAFRRALLNFIASD
ncbi:non-heme chloroperoxidase [Abditibacteriota bacterium]|nr:non-heme chloroperoxidase [Abditibacteriota bacterium]